MVDRRATPRSTPDRRQKPWAGVRERRQTPWAGPRERRAAPRTGVLCADAVHVEALDLRVAALHAAEWSSLAARAAEPNPFFEPEFLLPAASCLQKRRQPAILVARRRIEGRMRIIGLLPLAALGQRLCFGPARAWRTPLMPLGAPLLDRDFAESAIAAFATWLKAFRTGSTGLLVHGIPTSGFTARAMRGVAARLRLRYREFEIGERAALIARADPATQVSPAKRKQLARLRRRLSEKGTLAFRMETGEAADASIERFLDVEASGWKGERGTALKSDPVSTDIARAFLRRLAHQGRCYIAMLELDGAPIAASAVVTSGGRALYWKTGYDERYAAYSPGVQLSLELTKALLTERSIVFTDSGAQPGNRMIESLWRDRLRVADIMVGAPGFQFSVATRAEQLRRTIRSGAKAIYGLVGKTRR